MQMVDSLWWILVLRDVKGMEEFSIRLKWEKKFNSNSMNLPPPRKITPDGPELPLCLLGDEAFALTDFLMRPFPRRCVLGEDQLVYNYRHSRARRIIVCAFGMLVRRFQIFSRPMDLSPDVAIKMVQAGVCVHNFILNYERPPDFKDKNVLKVISSCTYTEGCQRLDECNDEESLTAISIRNKFMEYFINEGELSWQWERLYDYF